jgi:hypothetical protein
MRRSITGCSALLLGFLWAGPFGSAPALAGADDLEVTVVHALPSVGLPPGHRLQVNLVNDSAPGSAAAGGELLVRARVLDGDGSELARSASELLPRGATFSWVLPHAELAARTGERTRRIQLRAEIAVVGPLYVGAFVPSLELVAEATGEPGGMIGDVRTVISAEAAFQSANKGFY